MNSWADGWHAMSTLSTAPRLKEIKVPALCLVGEMDKSTPPPIARAMADAIPGGRYAIMPGAPHMMFIEQPAETARVVGGFLKAELSDEVAYVGLEQLKKNLLPCAARGRGSK